jgi:DNA-binding transcriptional ArsR family regulator
MRIDRLRTGFGSDGSPVTAYVLLERIDGQTTVADLLAETGLARTTLMYKLKQLRAGGYIEATKQGRYTFYRRTPKGDDRLAARGFNLTDLPSPRRGWKRRDRRQRAFRNDDGSLSYGEPTNTFNPQDDVFNPTMTPMKMTCSTHLYLLLISL